MILARKGNKTFALRREIKTKEENSMKENIDICVVFNLVNSNGTKLQLRMGRIKGHDSYICADRGFRWSFIGSKIPMPVRSDTWFNGFPENIMLDWLKGNGWALRSRVEMCTGKATVYELPEPSKGNENPIEKEKCFVPDNVLREGQRAFNTTIRDLCNAGMKIKAICLYRYVHPCDLVDAKHAVDEIQFDEQK